MTSREYTAGIVALERAAETLCRLDLHALFREAVRLDGGTEGPMRHVLTAAMVFRAEYLVNVRGGLNGATEAAGLLDEEVAALILPPADEAGSGIEDTRQEAPSVPDLGIPPARLGSASDPAPPAISARCPYHGTQTVDSGGLNVCGRGLCLS